jgi:hypothetical protein
MTHLEELARRSAAVEQRAHLEFWANLMECSQILNNIAPAKRKPWLAHIIQELHKTQHGLCALCNEPISLVEFDVDHKVPFCYGGGNERGNIQLAHVSCNRSKRAEVDPHDLLAYLEDRYMNLNPAR